jgi:hypothetical protein
LGKAGERGIVTSFTGDVIEESLENKEVLKKIKIVSTRVEAVIEKHQTPWLSQWTLHTVDIPENEAEKIAEEISRSLDRDHGGSWYADFKNATHHYIIYRDKIFYVDRKSKTQYEAARQYGLALGIPEYQVNFLPEVVE